MRVKLYTKIGIFLLSIFFVSISQLEAKIVTKQSSQCFNKIAGDNEEFIKYRKDFIYVYNAYLSNDMIALESFIDAIAENKEPPKYMLFYLNALANYYLGALIATRDQNMDEAVVYLDKAKDLIVLSLEHNDKFNESLRLAGEIYGQLISARPLMSIFYLNTANSYLSKSRLINADNPLLNIVSGVTIYSTPFLLGGDTDKAKEMFDKAHEVCPLLETASVYILWYDFMEDKVNKKTCDFYIKHKYLENVEALKSLMIEVEKQCDLLNEA